MSRRGRTWPSGSPRRRDRGAHDLDRAGPRASTSPCFRCCAAVVGDRVRRLEPGDRPAAGRLPAAAPGASARCCCSRRCSCSSAGAWPTRCRTTSRSTSRPPRWTPAECEIVELAAVRVRGRVIVEQFQRLVRPSRPISPAGDRRPRLPGRGRLRPADLRRGLAGVPRVRRRRSARGAQRPHLRRARAPPARGRPAGHRRPGVLRHAAAGSLADGRAAPGWRTSRHRFGVSAGRSHHALDDAAALAGVVRHLGELSLARARKTALVQLLGWLGPGAGARRARRPGAGGAAAPGRRAAGGPRPVRRLPRGLRRAGGRDRTRLRWRS